MDHKRFEDERWLLAENSTNNNTSNTQQDEDDEEEEETLSLCDLPQGENTNEDEKRSNATETQEDFNFCRSFSSKSAMCTADEVFFQGQILPLRHSVSSEKGLLKHSVSRSESMDRFYSNGLFSSRSSSLNSSHQSSSSGSSVQRRNPKPPRNRFHSHPSPSPRIHKPGVLNLNSNLNLNASNANYMKRSSVWSIFRLGLVTPPPEIAFQDLKTRFPSKRSNSKNSTNSSGSAKNANAGEKKKIKRVLFGGGCKCAADAIDTVPSKTVKSRSGSENSSKVKKDMSHHRTFEWLRQLSLEAASDD